MSNQYELEVQRRVTDILASAGVGRGVISQAVLYMLPPEFTREYEKLFHQALREGTTGSGTGQGVEAGGAGIVAKVPANTRGERGSMRASGGGKKYRTHWVIQDEAAVAVKRRLDKKLVRLAGKIPRELAYERDETDGQGLILRCVGGCGMEVEPDWRHCPGCGTRQEQIVQKG